MAEMNTRNIFATDPDATQEYSREALIIVATVLTTLFAEHFVFGRKGKNEVTEIN